MRRRSGSWTRSGSGTDGWGIDGSRTDSGRNGSDDSRCRRHNYWGYDHRCNDNRLFSLGFPAANLFFATPGFRSSALTLLPLVVLTTPIFFLTTHCVLKNCRTGTALVFSEVTLR